jgi:DNA helicase-2/ATP-dependent DNA helicase PcrA
VRTPNGIHTFDDLHRRLVRYLIAERLIEWPGGVAPTRIDDSWNQHEDSTNRLKHKDRCSLLLDDEGVVSIGATRSNITAPSPCFTDPQKYLAALSEGICTHAEIRGVLSAALDDVRYPTFNQAMRSCLAAGTCHILIDEAFDMNPLDARIVERAIEAGITVTMVGDPWQTLYEFRGSTPKVVSDLINNHGFANLPMRGSRRFETPEMRELADLLFDRKWFAVQPAGSEDDFDVVIAQDWLDLWTYDNRPVLPAGRPSRMDGGWAASCFVLVLNEIVFGLLGIEATGAGEARRRVGSEDTRAQLDAVVAVLKDPLTTPAEVWDTIRAEFGPIIDRRWKTPGAIAKQCMARLKQLATSNETPVLGLSVHQAKGLEWPRVLFLTSELSPRDGITHRLSLAHDNHRAIYVALTRAKEMVRVEYVVPRRGVDRAPVDVRFG